MHQFTRRHLFAFCAAPLVAAAFIKGPKALAGQPPVFVKGGFAVGGTDVVRYFTDAKPVAGSVAFSAQQDGATWLFSSAETRDAFVADPQAFLPAYGGYCAFAVSRGYTAPTRPEAWTIYDNRLYLNANLRVRARWLQDIPGHIASGNDNWPAVLD